MENRPAGSSSGGGGGGRSGGPRNRKSKNKRSRRKGENSRRSGGGRGGENKGGNKRNKGPPSPPQTKIVIRNIGDATKYGSVESVVGLIRSFLDGANQKLAALNSRTIQLDESSVACAIQEAEAVLKAQEEAEKAAASEANDVKEDGDNAPGEENGEAEAEKEGMEKNGAKPNEKSDGSVQDAPSVALSQAEFSTTNIGARIVYIVPPKQTRRRGIKPGCTYLVISGPRIEAKDPPAESKPKVDSSDSVASTTKEEKKDVAQPEDKNGDSKEEQPKESDAQDDSKNGNGENHVVILDPLADKTTAPSTPPAVDYSREVAKGRFLVVQAIGVMEEHAKEDAKSEQHFAGSLVEVALSGKTYKQQFPRRDRREGTVETTADFKTFMEKAAQAKEERLARPKPAPGGGVSTGGAATTETAESGQPIAALVEHIRSKHLEASKRKKAKKKAKDSTNKDKSTNASGKSSRKKKKPKGKEGSIEEGGKKGGRKKERSKKGKKPGKNKNGKAGNNATTAAPTALLKPSGASTQQKSAPNGGHG